MAAVAVLVVVLVGSAYAYRTRVGPFTAPPPPSARIDWETVPANDARPEDAPGRVAESVPSLMPSNAPAAFGLAQTMSADAGPSSAPATSAPPVTAESVEPTTEASDGLLSFEAHVTVRSSVDAEVVVQGRAVGKTNQRLLTRCGPRNVRLRTATGAWLTAGQHVRITCMMHTAIRLEPSP